MQSRRLRFVHAYNCIVFGYAFVKIIARGVWCSTGYGLFPVQVWMDSLDKLNATELSNCKDFYSTLMRKGMTDKENSVLLGEPNGLKNLQPVR